MVKYTLRRILLIIPTLLIIVFVVFMILSLTPSNPGRMMLGPTATEEQVAAINREFGLEDPILLRYVKYMSRILQGDFGTSYRNRIPVYEHIMPRFPFTLQLASLSVFFSAIIGIPLGVLSAVKRYSIVDHITTVLALLFASIPSFWLGLMAMLLLSLILGWLPSSGVGTWKHMIMPVLTMAVPAAAYTSRLTRATMLDAIDQDYIRTARSKGASNLRQVFGHALRNAMLPVVNQLGVSFASLLGGSLIVEIVFGLPGLGNVIIAAIRIRDVPVVLGAVIFLSALFMIIMLIVDIIYGLIDPRIRAENSD